VRDQGPGSRREQHAKSGGGCRGHRTGAAGGSRHLHRHSRPSTRPGTGPSERHRDVRRRLPKVVAAAVLPDPTRPVPACRVRAFNGRPASRWDSRHVGPHGQAAAHWQTRRGARDGRPSCGNGRRPTSPLHGHPATDHQRRRPASSPPRPPLPPHSRRPRFGRSPLRGRSPPQRRCACRERALFNIASPPSGHAVAIGKSRTLAGPNAGWP